MSQLIKEVTNALTENEDAIQSLFQSEFDMDDTRWQDAEATELRLALEALNIHAKHEDNFGGEGEGEDYWSVYKFTKDGESVYVKFQGWHQSYNGSEYDSYSFVNPKEVMITIYE